MKLIDNIKEHLRKWLIIREKTDKVIYINSEIGKKDNVIKNHIWARGQASELQDLYAAIDTDRTSFWSASSSNEKFRKIHLHLINRIVELLSNIVVSDINKLETNNEEYNDILGDIFKENDIKELIQEAVEKTLYLGDGAFKISINSDVSQKPIISFEDALNLDLKFENGRVTEYIFKRVYQKSDYEFYTLLEHYGYGYITYKLYDKNDDLVPINTIEETADLVDVSFDKSLILAVHTRFFKSNLFKNYGKSIIDGKEQELDSLDEAYSQWWNALRMLAPTKSIPTDMIEKDEYGRIIDIEDFTNQFIKLNVSSMNEDYVPNIDIKQTVMDINSYLTSYKTAYDNVLSGLVSSSSLGTDGNMLKDDTATAQVEREKVTIYTRNKIVNKLNTILENLIITTLKTYLLMYNKNFDENTEINIEFGEYASPSFDSVVDLMIKASAGQAVMSVEQVVEEMYGDTFTDKQKEEEVKRIKELRGIIEDEFIEEPMIKIENEEYVEEEV